MADPSPVSFRIVKGVARDAIRRSRWPGRIFRLTRRATGTSGCEPHAKPSQPRLTNGNSQALFRSDPEVHILLATDAAGEGVNLQNGNLMFNDDIPWNLNRLEQRFGRIHRIGQEEPGWGVSSVNHDLKALLALSTKS